jgi:thiol-disulfide isomerase/thioredoxin
MKKLCILFILALLFTSSCNRSRPVAPMTDFPPRQAPTWKLQTTDGRTLSSTELSGKVQLINFWATWCPPCNAEIPDLIELQNKFGKDGLVIVGVSVDQDGADVVKRFVENKKINYTVALAADGIETVFGKFEGIPTTFIIDRKGMIRSMDVGYLSAEDFEKRIKPLLEAQ